MQEKGLRAEIKDAEHIIALTEEKCAAMTQHIPEIMELEKMEEDQVTEILYFHLSS